VISLSQESRLLREPGSAETIHAPAEAERNTKNAAVKMKHPTRTNLFKERYDIYDQF